MKRLIIDFEFSPREMAMFAHRFGITTGVMHTLEETGAEYGVTRERVRQATTHFIHTLIKAIENGTPKT